MTCQLKAIVAVCDDWGIGRDGDMVVSNRADMRHFVACTKGHPSSWAARPWRAFPAAVRSKTAAISSSRGTVRLRARGVEVVHSVDEALTAVADEEVAWVIGGGSRVRAVPALLRRGRGHAQPCGAPADTFFPNLDEDAAWIAAERQGERTIEEGQGDAGLRYEFVTYRKVSS